MGALLKLTLFGILLAFLGERIMRFRHRMNFSREVEPKELSNCQLLKGIGYFDPVKHKLVSCTQTYQISNIFWDTCHLIMNHYLLFAAISRRLPDLTWVLQLFLSLGLNGKNLLASYQAELTVNPAFLLAEYSEFGSEDIDILPNGLAFISSGLKYPGVISFAPEKPGEIFLLDFNEENLHPRSLRFSKGFDISTFNPHGISTYIDEKDDTVYLFVVSHPHYKTTIEIFKFEEEENVLVHLKTIKHNLLPNANNIVALGPDSFYATNDYFFTDFTMRHVELFLGLPWTNVVYYSPNEVREVANGFDSANGIAMSTDKKYVYVADIFDHTINILEKHANWSLSPVKVVQLDTLLDNLFVDPYSGDIWTGGHPNAGKLFFYNSEDLPGSEVVRVQNIHSDNPIITNVYVNNGSVIQGSSCAAVYKGKILVGTVFHKAVCCDLE